MVKMDEVIGTPVQRIRAVGDGDTIGPGSKKLFVFYLPGHSGDHVSFYEERQAHFPRASLHVLIILIWVES